MKLKIILAEILRLEPDKIVESISMDTETAWDSLVHMDLVARIEEDYDIRMEVDEIVEITSFEKILRLLHERDIEP